MLTWVQQDPQGLHNSLQRNTVGWMFVWWNRHLEVLDPILFHKLNILTRIVFRDERADAGQQIMVRESQTTTHRMLFSPRECKCSKLPAEGKLLR